MRKIIAALFMLFLLIACGGKDSPIDPDTPKPNPKPNPPTPPEEIVTPPRVRGFMVSSAEYLDKNTINDAKSWGANVIRMQFNPLNYAIKRKRDFWEALPDYLNMVQTKIDAARSIGIKVIIDLHEPPITIDGKVPSTTTQGKEEFWENPELKTNFIRMWKEIATKFKDNAYNDVIWGYDLFNEPQINWQYPPKQWREMSPDIISAIRAIDKDVWIVYQPGINNIEYKDYEPLKDKRVIYSIHFYRPFYFTHQGVEKTYGAENMSREQALATIQKTYPDNKWNRSVMEADLRTVADFSKKNNVPILIGEFSVIAWAPIESSKAWLTDAIYAFEKYNFSWCYHAFREWQGWSLEHAEGTNAFWFKKDPTPAAVKYETERAKIIKAGFKKNK